MTSLVQRVFRLPKWGHRSGITLRRKRTTSSSSTINEEEVNKFEKMASEWWSPTGPMKELHSMNMLRVPLIRNGLLCTSPHRSVRLNHPLPLEDFKILDVGCGGGILTEPLGKLGANVLGIDPGKENVAVANSHLPKSLAKNVSYDCCTLEELATTNLKFDGVVMSETIEHVENREKFLQCAKDVLKPGGSLFVTTLNRTSESWLGAIVAWEYILGRLPVGTHDWHKFITPKELISDICSDDTIKIYLVHGMCYNPFTNKWSWSKSTSINYCVHGVKI